MCVSKDRSCRDLYIMREDEENMKYKTQLNNVLGFGIAITALVIFMWVVKVGI